MGERVLANPSLHRSPIDCTGLAAAWCPKHGDCTCPVGDDGISRYALDHPSCPLHGLDSDHCEDADDA